MREATDRGSAKGVRAEGAGGGRARAWRHDESERDACAIIANVKKDGRASHGNVKRTLEALARMGHRAGEVEGEGDGAGLQADIPRELWARRLEAAGLSGSLAERPQFVVAHLMIPHEHRADAEAIKRRALSLFEESVFEVLTAESARVRPEALGPRARAAEPEFWQATALPRTARGVGDRHIFHITLRLERELPVHVVSLSPNSVIYKVRGDAETLRRYFPELSRPDFKSAITLGHGRYSTNTDSRAERAQMFSTLGHNGEINSIDRLGREALALGFQLPARASDSQVLDRVVESFMFEYGLSLMDALELVFPPVWSEVERFPAAARDLYRLRRRAFGAHAQGPAAIIARQADEVVFSTDALGLRPLWCGETEKEFFASSEKGVVPLEQMVRDPRPLAPGEKMGFLLRRGAGVDVFEYHELQQRLLEGAPTRPPARAGAAAPSGGRNAPRPAPLDERALAAFGWNRLDAGDVREMAAAGKEPISGLGWDGPLAALSQQRRNLADYFHERVAVVTNPAIDREREADHFSLRSFLGARPSPARAAAAEQIELLSPLLLGGAGDEEADAAAARGTGQRTLGEVLALCAEAEGPAPGALRWASVDITFDEGETLERALRRLEERAARLVRESKSSVLVLDDARAWRAARLGIDPHLALAAVDGRLRDERDGEGVSLRRHTSLVLRSGGLRNVHDLALALGCGADAVNPYALYGVAAGGSETAAEREVRLRNCVAALLAGVEKVLSTMGIHELDGYGRLFGSVGLAPEVAEYFGTPDYCGSARAGLSLRGLDSDARERLRDARGQSRGEASKPRPPGLPGEFRAQPTLWNAAGRVARGEQPYEQFAARARELEETRPVALRHLLEVRAAPGEPPPAAEVDTRAGRHAAPFYFSAMSFGSQGETSFRAYAEAARRLDIICVNGEGGELPDLLGRYREHRGQQLASGRFGVNARLLNSCDLIEIKIGQGAKPGEGGLLPGFKVTPRIAETRHTPAGIDLISPSNNHDIYSIEDLAQVVQELKTVNPLARISVKIPSVPHLGPVATGIAKAQADIIAVSGYDGGTGAARKHSLRHTGLPVETGLREAHRALIRAGLRGRVELWADGGVKSGRDVVKLLMLGADRVGFATMAMAAIGCTSCRECNTGTCHVGITSQLGSAEEALAAGQKRFRPREYERAVEHLVRFFGCVREEVARETARAGLTSTRALVGRVDLLEQARGRDRLDLSWLLEPDEACRLCLGAQEPHVGRARRSLTSLTRMISDSVAELAGAGKEVVYFDDAYVSSGDRALGTHLAGALTRERLAPAGRDAGGNGHGRRGAGRLRRAVLNFLEGSVPGNGLGAFNAEGVDIVVHGGVQDGACKGASGGSVRVLKGVNHDGLPVDGSVGKCFAYGAQAGVLVVQGDADSRAGIRLSGADLVFGGRLRAPLRDELGNIAARANLKGFAFEYMTSGRGLVLGDPGPWLCSGMTGGVVYLHLEEELGLDAGALRRRLAAGAKVRIEPVSDGDGAAVLELLGHYREALAESQQHAEAAEVSRLAGEWRRRFVKVVPGKE